MKEISVQELKAMQDKKEDFQLLDIREEYEYDICNLGGKLIPMGDIADNIEQISKDKKVVVHCRSGKRSASVIQMLEQQYGFTNLYNLRGGIMAWAEEIDHDMAKY